MTLFKLDDARDVAFEEKLLVTCLQSAAHIREGNQPGLPHVDDWRKAVRTMILHGIMPLAAVVLAGGDKSADVPPQLLDSLKRARHMSVITHRAALNALGRIDPMLRQAGVAYAVMKGPHLYETLYRNSFPRPYGDIDMLVRRRDLDRALRILRDAGYDPVGSGLNQFMMRHGHFHLVLDPVANPGFPKIELHWSLVDRANLYRIDDEAVMSRATELKTEHARFGILSNEDTFLYLCLHVVKHGLLNSIGLRSGHPVEWFCHSSTGNRLIWYIDLDLFLRKEMEHMDWDVLRRRAAEWNVAADVIESLRVMNLLLPDSPAGAAMEKLSPGAAHTPPDAGGWLDKFLQTPNGARTIDVLMRMDSNLFFRPARLLFLGSLLFPPPRELRAYYGRPNPWQTPFIYLIHPLNMLRKLVW
jgi:hypothetical protein